MGGLTQEDPIGLAGGLNLYGYAGGDPINSWDPFGLYDVKYGDSKTEKDVAALRSASQSFDAAMTQLENDSTVLVTIGRGSTAPCGGSGGCAQRLGTNRAGQRVFSVTLSEGGVASQDALLRSAGGANMLTTIAHEVYGHVIPWRNGTHCADGFPGTPAAGSCAVTRENVIRAEMRVSLRTKY